MAEADCTPEEIAAVFSGVSIGLATSVFISGALVLKQAFEPVLFVRQRLGGKEGSAAFDACPEAAGLRLTAVE